MLRVSFFCLSSNWRLPPNPAIRGTAKANLHLLRSALASYAAVSEDVLYPVGDFNYDQLRAILPPNLLTSIPETLKEAKWADGSFSYSSKTGETYSIVVKVRSAQGGIFTGTPKEILFSTESS